MRAGAKRPTHNRLWVMTAVFLCGAAVLFLIHSVSVVAGDKTDEKRMVASQAYELYKQKCLGCHDSVADPEKPGRTRDDWHLVVTVMHNYGLAITADEGDTIVQLLYDLRKGLEKEAG